MKIAVFGAGYVGLVTGTCFAELGNDVILADIDKKRIEDLKKGKMPIFEPNLEKLAIRNTKEGRLKFTTNASFAITNSDIIFIAVGTPPKDDGSSDLSYVLAAAKTIGENIDSYKVVASKSTVPVGTAEMIKKEIKKHQKNKIDFDVVSNPEFLREGNALRDFLAPDRVVVGSDSDKASKMMREIYEGVVRVERPIIITDVKTSEIIKYAANAMLACRISFMNELSHLCDKVGADIKKVATGLGFDKRIGSRYLQAGIGYGGSCFPKDVKSLAHTLKKYGLSSELISAIDKVNEKQKYSLLPKIKNELGENLKGKKIGILGLAFKPKTDDMREAPSVIIINELKSAGAHISAFDPEAVKNAQKIISSINYCKEPYECAKDADALIIVTEWDEFRNLDMEKIKKLMKTPIIFDGRNIYDPKKMKELGFKYYGVGRK